MVSTIQEYHTYLYHTKRTFAYVYPLNYVALINDGNKPSPINYSPDTNNIEHIYTRTHSLIYENATTRLLWCICKLGANRLGIQDLTCAQYRLGGRPSVMQVGHAMAPGLRHSGVEHSTLSWFPMGDDMALTVGCRCNASFRYPT